MVTLTSAAAYGHCTQGPPASTTDLTESRKIPNDTTGNTRDGRSILAKTQKARRQMRMRIALVFSQSLLVPAQFEERASLHSGRGPRQVLARATLAAAIQCQQREHITRITRCAR